MPAPTTEQLRELEKRSATVSRTDQTPTILLVSRAADEAPEWWSPQRDIYLRKFFPSESYLAGALYSVCSRNASYSITFKGPSEGVRRAYQLLHTANMFDGWQNFSLKVSLDLYSTDNGSFFEIIRPARVKVKGLPETRAVKMTDENGDMVWAAVGRKGYIPLVGEYADFKIIDNPLDLPIGLNHLDSVRCTRTGDAEFPIIYTDKNHMPHKLRWHQVVSLEDMPTADADWNDIGYCAVTRALRLSQTLRDMTIYKQEKISGRFAGQVHLTNVDTDAIQDAVDQSKAHMDNLGLSRYAPPIIAYTMEPNATPAVASINLASLPDNFNEETAMRWYIAGLALDLGVDYGFLAPLPGNKLGTSEQAEVADRQSKGKASRLYMSQMEEKFNYRGLLPRNVWMEFEEVDAAEESERDTARARRAKTRSERIASQEITPEVARQIAHDDGDLDEKYLKMMEEADLSPEYGSFDPSTGKPRTGLNMGYGRPKPSTVLDPKEEPTEAKVYYPGFRGKVQRAIEVLTE